MHLVQRFRDSDCLCDEQTKSRPARKQTTGSFEVLVAFLENFLRLLLGKR